MLRYKQYTPFTVLEFETDMWEYPVHKHNYYEIIFIREGEGTQTINDQTFPYLSGDIFLLSPEDYHSFDIRKKTSFCFFKFTELVFKKKQVRSRSESLVGADRVDHRDSQSSTGSHSFWGKRQRTCVAIGYDYFAGTS